MKDDTFGMEKITNGPWFGDERVFLLLDTNQKSLHCFLYICFAQAFLYIVGIPKKAFPIRIGNNISCLFFYHQKINSQVNPLISASSSSEEKAKKINQLLFKTDSDQSLPKLLEKKRYGSALSVINAAVDEIVDSSDESIKQCETDILRIVERVNSRKISNVE